MIEINSDNTKEVAEILREEHARAMDRYKNERKNMMFLTPKLLNSKQLYDKYGRPHASRF
jgi:hypothetical protein